MSWYIKFGNYPYSPEVRIFYKFPHLLLGVVVSIGGEEVKERESPGFKPEALIVTEVKVENIHFYRCHGIYVSLENFHGHKMPYCVY